MGDVVSDTLIKLMGTIMNDVAETDMAEEYLFTLKTLLLMTDCIKMTLSKTTIVLKK